MKDGTKELPADAPASVEFDDVRFGYDDTRRPVLDGFSLTIEPGETVAVVGASGSGKSTVSLLLPRFYDVSHGAVLVGGHDVRELTLDSLRAAIGLVPEDSFLFSDTVRANIAYGLPGATDEQIEQAARSAQADRFIAELPTSTTTPRSASTGSPSPAASASASHSPAPSSPTPACSSSTTPPPPWTPASSTRSTRPCAR